jgi:hypothetical protein
VFRSTSISVILLALAICAASPSRCFAQAEVPDLLIPKADWSVLLPYLSQRQAKVETGGAELENPFDPFPDASEVVELDSILATWDQVFAELSFNTRKFRRWDYDPVSWPKDPNQVNQYREGVITRAARQEWSIRETHAVQFEPVYEPADWGNLVLFRDFFAPRYKVSTEKPTQRAWHTSEWAWDEQSFAFWSSNKSKPTVVPLAAEKGEPPLVAALAYCGNGQAREYALRYWMRVVSRESADERPRIEIRPRLETDARSWQKIIVLLAADQTPYAIEITDKKDRRTAFEFTGRTYQWWAEAYRFHEIARLRRQDEEAKKARN